jgi:hypothetical protein
VLVDTQNCTAILCIFVGKDITYISEDILFWSNPTRDILMLSSRKGFTMTYIKPLSRQDIILRNSNLVTEQGRDAAQRQDVRQVEMAETMMETLIDHGEPMKARDLFEKFPHKEEQDARQAMWRLIDFSFIRIIGDRRLELVPEDERTTNVGWY